MSEPKTNQAAEIYLKERLPHDGLCLLEFCVLNAPLAVITDKPDAVKTAAAVQFGVSVSLERRDRRGAALHKGVLFMLDSEEIYRDAAKKIGFSRRFSLDGVEIEMTDDGNAMVRTPGGGKRSLRATMHGLAAFVRMALKADGIYFFHAGAVMKNEKAVVFAGDNDSGKSSLVRRFIAGGWNFLADDNLPASVRNGSPVVHFIGESVNLERMSVKEWSEMERLGFRASALPGFFRAENGRETVAGPEVIFFLQSVAAGAGMEKISRADAASRMMGLNKTPIVEKDYARFMDTVCGLTADTENYIVEFNPSKETPDIQEKLLKVAAGTAS